MSVIRIDLAHAAIARSLALIDYNKCQLETLIPTDWIDGRCEEWDSEKQQLKRFGKHEVILKRLENVESANQSWFEEAKSHLTIEEELEAFHSKSYDFSIPANINDFNKPRNQSNNNTSKLHSIFNANSKNLSKTFEKLPIKDEIVQQTKGPYVISDSEKLPKEFINLQINSNKIIKQQMKRKNIDSDDDEKEVIQQKTKRQNINDIDDDDEMYNNPNLHSEEQDELEIPVDGF
ncbi:kinase-like domain-containing protein [Rhizophagus irregularis DAOM 181602=DAOM 197198]|nr:kinase-like domain-containing protein [Rhizophagus irregularis DAOM 181602=DAOM 197198]